MVMMTCWQGLGQHDKMQPIMTPAVLQQFQPHLDNTDSSYGNEDNDNNDMLAETGPAGRYVAGGKARQ